MAKYKIAVTGGIGSGKTTVINIVRDFSYSVFSADNISAEALADDKIIKKIADTFGGDFLNKSLPDKKKLADLIFNDFSAKKKLEKIVHPYVMEKLNQSMKSAEGLFLFAEIPLLFETNMQNKFDRVLVVMKDKEERVKLVMQRNKLTEGEVLKIMDNQFDYLKLDTNAYTLIYNDGGLESLKFKVYAEIENLKKIYR